MLFCYYEIGNVKPQTAAAVSAASRGIRPVKRLEKMGEITVINMRSVIVDASYYLSVFADRFNFNVRSFNGIENCIADECADGKRSEFCVAFEHQFAADVFLYGDVSYQE